MIQTKKMTRVEFPLIYTRFNCENYKNLCGEGMKKVFHFFVFLYFIVLLFAACKNETPQPQDTGYSTPTIVGRIVAPNSSVSSSLYAKVGETGKVVQASSDGSFVISGLEENKRYTLYFTSYNPTNLVIARSASSTSYGLQMSNVVAFKDDGNDIGAVNLLPTVTVSGKVVMSNGQALPDVSVKIPGTAFSASTDSSGNYIIKDIPQGSYEIRYEKEGYRTESKSLSAYIVSNDSSLLIPDVKMWISDVDMDETLEFGKYDNESIKWLVLDKKDNKTLVISRDILFKKSYDDMVFDVTWESCTLRSYLNDDFYNTAFSEEEKKLITRSKIENPDNPIYGTGGGNATEDYIFLLSVDEAHKYYKADADRSCGEEWWLRTLGSNKRTASFVNINGYINHYGYRIDNYGVRPALWLNTGYPTPTIVGRIVAPNSSVSSSLYVMVGETGNVVQASSDGSFVISGLEENKGYTLFFTNYDPKNLVIPGSASSTSYGLKMSYVVAFKDDGNDIGTVNLLPTVAVSGKVVMSNGQALPDVSVKIPGTAFSASTDSSGNYNIKGIPQGSYEIRYEKEGYKAVSSLFSTYIASKDLSLVISDVNMYETLEFGKYNNESIKWLVLDKKDNKTLVISKDILFKKAYNDTNASVTWQDCTLRSYLNNEFYNTAFSEEEKKLITNSKIETPDNPNYGTKGGNATEDYIFLLSVDEASKYFKTKVDRSCGERWWLRSPGAYQDCATLVNNDGDIDDSGCSGNYRNYGVRPALWLDLNQ